MDLAITIGSYQLTDFVELNLKKLRGIFGPGVPILVSDDRSPNSPAIEALAHRYQADYYCSSGRRYHFAGDAQAFINAVRFAEARDCDLALKISQRVILVLAECAELIPAPFVHNPEIDIALPGQPKSSQLRSGSSKMYGRFNFLTDLVAVRVAKLPGDRLAEEYRNLVTHGKTPYDCYIEHLWLHLLSGPFNGRHYCWPEFTDHVPGELCRYLRKSQNDVRDYRQVAAIEGLRGNYDLGEWNTLEVGYNPRPRTL